MMSALRQGNGQIHGRRPVEGECEVDERQEKQGTEIRHAVQRHQHHRRSEEHTSELQSLMRISYAVFCLKTKHKNDIFFFFLYNPPSTRSTRTDPLLPYTSLFRSCDLLRRPHEIEALSRSVFGLIIVHDVCASPGQRTDPRPQTSGRRVRSRRTARKAGDRDSTRRSAASASSRSRSGEGIPAGRWRSSACEPPRRP